MWNKISRKNKARVVFYSLFISAVVSSVFWMKSMPGISYSGKPLPLTQKQIQNKALYLKQLNEFATTPHNFMYPKELEKTKNFIKSELENYGYKVNTIQYGQQKFANLEVVVEPQGENKGTIVIGAHYDSEEISPGANDNGSGVVILLDLAKRFKNLKTDHRLRLVFFVNEEPPYFRQPDMGSTVYADRLVSTGENIQGMYAFDVLGYYFEEDNTQHYPILFAPFFPSKANFVAFVGGLSSRELIQKSVGAFRENAHFAAEGVSAPSYIQGIDFSDHLSFTRHHIPALMITDTAFFRSRTYHTANDTIDRLNLDKMTQLTDELEKMFTTLYGIKK